MKKWFVRILVGVLVIGAIATLALVVFFAPTKIAGRDMWPSIGDGSWLLVKRRATPERGDIILFKGPGDAFLIRRVVALPGDQVGYANGHVVVEGHPATYEKRGDITVD